MSSSGQYIMSERNLRERNEWLAANRRELEPYLNDDRDCIIFTFTRQEPADRMITRIGGLPYWPRSMPWPECPSCGDRLEFVAQLDFREHVLFMKLPGDVLTFHYCVACWPWSPADAGGSLLRWHKPILPQDLITQSDLPTSSEAARFGPFYGTAHREADYPTPRKAFGGGIAGVKFTHLHFTLQGVKIGCYPPPIQGMEVPVDARGHSMPFLGSIGSVQGYVIDQAGDAFESHNDLLWGDQGAVYLWMSLQESPNPEMAWFIQSS